MIKLIKKNLALTSWGNHIRIILPQTLLPTKECRYIAQHIPGPKEGQTNYLPITVNTIWDNPGARKKAIRTGRGPGSGKGKTCGYGHKGYNARNTSSRTQYEGGQTPLTMRVPKRGFTKKRYTYKPNAYVNIDTLVYYIIRNKLDPTKEITMRDIFNCGAVTKLKYGLTLLGKGKMLLEKHSIGPLTIECTDASEPAIQAITQGGGKVKCVYHTELTLRKLLKPHKIEREIKTPMPPPYKVKELELLKENGAEVSYPKAPWHEEKREKLDNLEKLRQERMDSQKFAELMKSPFDEEETKQRIKKYKRPNFYKEFNYGV